MPDMLVKLYDLPSLEPEMSGLGVAGASVRRANKNDKWRVSDWVAKNFSAQWSAECEASFALSPPCCFIAENDGLVGFACYNATAKNYFGPTGVADAARGNGIGSALLLCCLHELRNEGFAYAIIGGVGPADFYARSVGATLIEGSDPGIYTKEWFEKMQPHQDKK